RRSPPERRDEAAGRRRNEEDAEAYAARDDAHGQAPARREPAGGRGGQRHVERTGPDRSQDSECGIELGRRADLAGENERRAEDGGAEPGHAARPDSIREGAPGERAEADDHPVDEGDPGDQGSSPAELLLERAKEHSQREDRAGAHGDEADRRGQDDPAVEDRGSGLSRCGGVHAVGLYALRMMAASTPRTK